MIVIVNRKESVNIKDNIMDSIVNIVMPCVSKGVGKWN